MSIQLFKEGDALAIQTDCQTEIEFVREFSVDLDSEIRVDVKSSCHDLENWIHQVVDLCCAFRGYKTEVHKRTVMIAGSRIAPESPLYDVGTPNTIALSASKNAQGGGASLPVEAFVEGLCVLGAGLETPVQELWTAWVDWRHANDQDPSTIGVFCRDLRRSLPDLRPVRRKSRGENRPRSYAGIGLQDLGDFE